MERERERKGWGPEEVRSRRTGRARFPTIFIGNLPKTLDKFGLSGIVCKHAKVKSSTIIFKRNSAANFGFVQLWSINDAENCIYHLHKKWVRGLRVIADWANVNDGRKRSKYVWVPKKTSSSSSEKMNHSSSSEHQNVRIQGEVNVEFVDWLQRSLVCTSDFPRDLDALASVIKDNFGPFSKIAALSGFKFLLTFSSKQEMDEALADPRELNDWFTDIRPWSSYESADTRRVWVDILGVPPHGWKWSNFQKCVQPWGKLLSLARSIASTNQFEVMRGLIQSNVFRKIDGEVFLDINNCSFRIFVREINSHLIPPSIVHDPSFAETTSSGHSNDNESGVNDLDAHHSFDVVPESPALIARLVPQNLSGNREGHREEEVIRQETHEEEVFRQETGMGSGEAINLSLAVVPVTNDEHLINVTAALGSNAAFGLEKSVEILNEPIHHLEGDQKRDSLPSD